MVQDEQKQPSVRRESNQHDLCLSARLDTPFPSLSFPVASEDTAEHEPDDGEGQQGEEVPMGSDPEPVDEAEEQVTAASEAAPATGSVAVETPECSVIKPSPLRLGLRKCKRFAEKAEAKMKRYTGYRACKHWFCEQHPSLSDNSSPVADMLSSGELDQKSGLATLVQG